MNRYNTTGICEACQLAKASPAENEKASNTKLFYESRRAVELKTLRRDLVAQLCGRQGGFWEAIKEVRGRRGISPITRIPPDPKTSDFLPDDAPRREQDERAWEEFMEAWQNELNSLIERFVPAKLSDVTVWPRWQDFIAACVLFDSPVPGFVEFADRMTPRGGEYITGPNPGAGMLEKPRNAEQKLLRTVLPPIKQLGDPQEERARTDRYWIDILKTVWELYVERQGLSFEQMLFTALKSENHRKKVEEWDNDKPKTSRSYYIEIDEFTSREDVTRAFSMLAAAQERRPPAARPKRDRLTCVEAAILHDKHGWTYERLAERYDWTDPTRASKFIKDGRALIKEE